MKTGTILCALSAICAYSAASAQSPFDGTWKLNVSKSQLVGATMTFQDAGNGALKYTDSAQSYTFKPDGSSFTTPLRDELTFQKTGDSSYTVITKRNGLLLDTETWKLSPDGNTLTIDSRGTNPNGTRFDDFETDVRTSPGAGLVGGWKSTKITGTSPPVLTIQTRGNNDVILTLPATKATVHGKWDGRDYSYRGPAIPTGATVALNRTGTRGFKLAIKLHGRVMQTLHFTVAAGGKSMVEKVNDGDGKELPFRQVWNKHS